jgi:membrane protease subunit HflC
VRRLLFVALVLLALAVGLVWAGNYGYGPLVITREFEQKLVLRWGADPVKVLDQPGIWPFRIPVIDRVEVFDRRLQHLDAEPVEMLIARGDKLIVSYYAVWRIADPLLFRQNFPKGMEEAEHRIQSKVRALVGDKIGGLTLAELLARSEVLHTLAEESNQGLADQGVHVVDVRLNRTEIPRNAEPAAYQQMREQRRARSREFRAAGEREARRVRAEAERLAVTTVAEARRQADVLRGEGDAEAARTYAAAYGQDPEFYAFVRSLEAYRKTIGDRTTLVLPPDHEFFRFLEPGQAPPAAGGP